MKSLLIYLLFASFVVHFVAAGDGFFYYTFVGTNCVEDDPNGCDFDDPSNFITDPSGAPFFTDLTTSEYNGFVYVPYQQAQKNFTIIASHSNGYKFAFLGVGISFTKKSIGQEIKRYSSAIPVGKTQVIFKNTKLFNLREIEAYDSSIIFENTELELPQGIAPTAGWMQKGNSLVKFTGTTTATLNGTFSVLDGDSFILDYGTKFNYVHYNTHFITSENPNSAVNIGFHGDLHLKDGWFMQYKYATVDFTGCNCTSPVGKRWSVEATTIIGNQNDYNQNNIVTTIAPFWVYGDVTVRGHAIVNMELAFIHRSIFQATDVSRIHVVDSENAATQFAQAAYFTVKGKSEVTYDKKIILADAVKKRETSATDLQKQITVEDGILQFNKEFRVHSPVASIYVNNPDGDLRFYGGFVDNNRYADLYFTNGIIRFYNFKGKDLSTSGVNYVFNGTIDVPSDLVLTKGNLITMGANFPYHNIVAKGTTITGYGTVAESVTLKHYAASGTVYNSSLFLNGNTNVGRLEIGGTLTLEANSKVTFLVNGNSCGSVNADTINITQTTFAVEVYSQPSQNITYIVAEYETAFYYDVFPESVDESLYTIEHDTVNKQIKVHYIYTPPPPTEPVTPTPDAPTSTPTSPPTPNSPTSIPTAAQTPPSNANNFSLFSSFLVSILSIIVIILF